MAKRKFGDRYDGKRLKNQPPLNIMMGCMYPNRCDNEGYIEEFVTMDAINNLLQELNDGVTDKSKRFTTFHIVSAAILRTLVLRPKMNYFIQGKKFYERNNYSLSFVIKKEFKDSAREAMAMMYFDKNESLISVHEKIVHEVIKNREIELDPSTQELKAISRLPHFLVRTLVSFLNFLDYRGWYPKSLAKVDMNYSSVFISNLGSIKLNASYHHLTNRGTNSIFLTIGEISKRPLVINDELVIKEILPLSMTIDERIAHGFYYAKTIQLFKSYLENPKQLLNSLTQEEIDEYIFNSEK